MQCGTSSCPDGYHIQSYNGCSSQCGLSCTITNNEICAINTSSFNQCGFDCPAGYRRISTGLFAGCGAATIANGATCSL